MWPVDGQENSKNGTMSGRAIKRETPTKQRGKFSGDGQPKPRSRRFTGECPVHLIEFFEDMGLLDIGDSRACVGDGYGELVPAMAA